MGGSNKRVANESNVEWYEVKGMIQTVIFILGAT